MFITHSFGFCCIITHSSQKDGTGLLNVLLWFAIKYYFAWTEPKRLELNWNHHYYFYLTFLGSVLKQFDFGLWFIIDQDHNLDQFAPENLSFPSDRLTIFHSYIITVYGGITANLRATYRWPNISNLFLCEPMLNVNECVTPWFILSHSLAFSHNHHHIYW